MKQTCPECNTVIELDEKKYSPGEVIKRECPVCCTQVEFAIPIPEKPKEEKPKVIVKEVKVEVESKESKENKEKLEALQKKLDNIEKKATTQHYSSSRPSSGGSSKGIIGIIVVLLLLAGGVGGYMYYNNVYLPEKIDSEAPRYYNFANLVLRSSKSSGADFNKVATLPYGTELITYEHDSDWSRIKVNSPSPNGEKLEGYVASPYLLNKQDFTILNSIFGDTDSKDNIATSKCRLALLNYFKDHQYIGAVSTDLLQQAGINIVPNSDNQWQVFTRKEKPNNEFYKRLINPNSKFTDFAIIIKNIQTGERKLIYFYFDDDETPHFANEQEAPSDGYIRNMYVRNGYLYVDYTN